MAGRLNEGALPVPLALVGQQSVEASLGQESLQKSLFAGMVGLICVVLFMIIYYRFLGSFFHFSLLSICLFFLSVLKNKLRE